MPCSPMPIATLRIAGRCFSTVTLNCSATFASAAPVTRSATIAGVHSALACTSMLQCALQSALISGGFTSPVHLGSLNSALHLPVQVPSHLADALILQL